MEGILAIIGFAFAIPGTIVAFAQCGEYISEKVSTFRNAPDVARELGRFGRNLHQGKLKLNLELAEWAYSLPDLDSVMKDGIEDHLDELRSRLRAVEHCLTKMFDERGEVRTLYFTFLGEKKAERLVQSLREWEHDFSNTLSLIEMKKRVLPRALQLTPDRFRCRYQSPLNSDKTIFVGAAEIMKGTSVCELQVLIERKNLQSHDNADDLQEIARILADLASRNTFEGGVLKCLGFSIGDIGQLVFELPEGGTKPRTLKDVIQSERDRPFAGGRPLNHRLRLAHSLCDTVVAVFTSGLVHKSIRTDTVLLISQAGDDESHTLGSPYLSSWTLVRKATALTSGATDDIITTNFYRHPKRQGIQPEDRYNMGHDIYSLGMCLLEIGLWTPLLEAGDKPCPCYQETAIKLNLVSEEEAKSASKLTVPWMVAKVLPQIAREQLPQRMGSRFTDFTIACLTCLEGGMGDSSSFRKKPSEAAVRFNELVAQTFNNLI